MATEYPDDYPSLTPKVEHIPGQLSLLGEEKEEKKEYPISMEPTSDMLERARERAKQLTQEWQNVHGSGTI